MRFGNRASALKDNPYFTQTAASIGVASVSFVLTVVLARRLGVEGFGQYNLFLTAAAIFYVFQGGGYSTLLFREMTFPGQACENANTLSGYAFGHLILISFIGMAGCAAYYQENAPGYILAVLAFGAQAVAGLVSSKLRAQGLFSLEAKWQIRVRLTGAAFILVILLTGAKQPCLFIGALAAGQFFALCFSPARLEKPIRHIPFRTPWRRSGLALVIIELATLAYHRIDVILLGWFSGAQALGNYVAAYKFIDAVILLLTPSGVVFFRIVRKSYCLKPSEAVKVMILFLAAFFVIALAMVVVLSVFAGVAIDRIFGENFTNGGMLLPSLSFSLLFMAPNIILSQAVISINRERLYATCACAAALFNITLNCFLIPGYGAEGACISAILTEFILMLCFSSIIIARFSSCFGGD